jgi:hypothetical protein
VTLSKANAVEARGLAYRDGCIDFGLRGSNLSPAGTGMATAVPGFSDAARRSLAAGAPRCRVGADGP